MNEPASHLFSPPKQRRSRESLERVLKAARELLEEGGYEALSMEELAQRADVNVSSIYARLGSKQGVLYAVHAELLAELADEDRAFGTDIGSDATPEDVIAGTIAELAALFRRHERLLRVFMIQGDVDEEILRRAAPANAATADAFERRLLTRRHAITHPDPELAADICFRIVYDTLARRLVRGPTFESPLHVPWDDLVDELAEVCASYLLRRRQRSP
jgi:AcrR family transcriptional regulator